MILSLILVAVLLPQAAPINVAQASSGSFAFSWTGNHANGAVGAEAPTLEFHYQPILNDPTAKLRKVRVNQAAVIGDNQVTMKLSLLGVEAGFYDLKVRLLGPAGLPSGYTDLLEIQVHVLPPQTPTGLRVVGN